MPSTLSRNGVAVEYGPLLPASEHSSLPLRVARNCQWNRCIYCTVYRGCTFGVRRKEDLFVEIERLAQAVPSRSPGSVKRRSVIGDITRRMSRWLAGKSRHVFLQDADALTVPESDLVAILKKLRRTLPVHRVVAFASTRSLLQLSKKRHALAGLRQAGLDKLLVGVESGSDRVLRAMCKGCSSAEHADACGSAMAAGFEVGCYIMPGLGGRALTSAHSDASSRLLRTIRPQQVLLRMLYCDGSAPLEKERRAGKFSLLEPTEMVEELRALLQGIAGTAIAVESSYDGNLLPDLEGRMDVDAERFDRLCRSFLSLPPATRDAYAVARRLGVVSSFTAAMAAPAALDVFGPVAQQLRAQSGGRLEMGRGGSLGQRAVLGL